MLAKTAGFDELNECVVTRKRKWGREREPKAGKGPSVREEEVSLERATKMSEGLEEKRRGGRCDESRAS
jgi:hypothetical protein